MARKLLRVIFLLKNVQELRLICLKNVNFAPSKVAAPAKKVAKKAPAKKAAAPKAAAKKAEPKAKKPAATKTAKK